MYEKIISQSYLTSFPAIKTKEQFNQRKYFEETSGRYILKTHYFLAALLAAEQKFAFQGNKKICK